jgi:hypothetical protein
MNHQFCRLVDDEQFLILVENLQGNFLGQHLAGFRLGPRQRNDITSFWAMGGFGGMSIDLDFALDDESLESAAGDLGKMGVEETIQPHGQFRFLNDEGIGG